MAHIGTARPCYLSTVRQLWPFGIVVAALGAAVPGVASAQEEEGQTGEWHENQCYSDLCHLEIPPLERPVAVLRHQAVMARNYDHLMPLLTSGRLDLKGKRVLDVATGTGAMALLAAHFGAAPVVATDIHPVALLNTAYNAELFGWPEVIEARLVTPAESGAFAPVAADERFDVIFCNPPWEDRSAERFEQVLDTDPGHALLLSLLDGLEDHLNEGGQLVMIYGPLHGLRLVQERAEARGWMVHITWNGSRRTLASFLARDRGFEPAVGVPPMVVISR